MEIRCKFATKTLLKKSVSSDRRIQADGDGKFTFCPFSVNSYNKRLFFRTETNNYASFCIDSSIFIISQLNLQDENLLAEIHQTQQRVGFGNPMVA